MADIAELGIRIDARQVRQGEQALDDFAKKGAKAEKAADGVQDAVKALGKGLAALGGIVSALELAGKLIDTQRAFDKLNASLITATGSAGNANVAFAALQRFAATTPYGLQDVTKAFIQLRNLGLNPSERALASYGNTASAMGKSLNQLVEAVADAATGEFERLKEFGIKSKQQGDQVAFTFQGTTTNVANNAKAIEEYLMRLGETKFAGGMELQAKTLDGAISNLADTWDMTLLTFSQSGFGDVAMQGVLALSGALQDLQSIIKAVTGEADKEGKKIEELGPLHQGLTTIFETIAVLGTNVAYVFTAIGKDVYAFSAAVMAAARGDFALAQEIAQRRHMDAEEERKLVDAKTEKILWASKVAQKVRENEQAEKEREKTDDLARFAIVTQAKNQQTAAQKKAAEDAASWYKKTSEAGRIGISVLEAELASQEVLTDAQRDSVKLMAELEKYRGNLTKKERDAIAAQRETIELLERVKTAREADRKASEDRAAAIKSETDAAWAQVRGIEEQIKYYGLSESQVLRLKAAEYDRQSQSAELTDEELARLAMLSASTTRQADLQDKLSKMKAQTSFWTDIESTARQTFLSIADGGKGAAERLKDSFKNIFFDWLYQQTLKKWIINVGTSVSGTAGVAGIANAAGVSSASGGISGSIGSLSGIGGVLGSIGSIGAGAVETAGAILSGQIGFGQTISAGLSAIGSGSAAGVSAGLSSLAGALGPIALGVAGIMALVSKWDDSGTSHTGGGSMATAAGVTNVDTRTLGFAPGVVTSSETQAFTSQLALSVVSILNSTATTFGKSAGYTAATAFADDTSKDGAWGALLIKNVQGTLVDWAQSQNGDWAPKVFADGEAGMKQYLESLSGSVRTALDQIGLPSWAQEMLTSLGSAPALEDLARVVDQINATQTVLIALGKNIAGFAGMSDAAAAALMKASGGIEALARNANSYYENFYTDAEKNAAVMGTIKTALQAVNLAVPATREQFRALVEQQMALGVAGAPAVAALLGVAGAFAQIVPAAEAAAVAAADTAQALKDAADAANQRAENIMSGISGIMESLRGAVERQRDVVQAAYQRTMDGLQGRIDTLNDKLAATRSLSNLLSNSLNGMSAPGQAAADKAAAQAQLKMVLAIAKSGGGLPDAGDLSSVIASATKDTADMFSSYIDYQADYAKTANDIAALSGLTDSQLTVQERQLAALEGQKEIAQRQYEEQIARLDGVLENAQRQTDLLTGVDATLMTIPGLLQALGAALGTAQSDPVLNARSQIGSAYQQYLGRAPDASGLSYWQGLYNNGTSLQAILDSIKNSEEARSIRGFASGGMHGGGWRIVGENGPELENTGASRIYSNSASMSLFAGVESRLDRLEAILTSGFTNLIPHAKRSADTLEKWDEDGLPHETDDEEITA